MTLPRAYILTLAYCPAAVLRATMEQVFRTTTEGLPHWIVDHHWPIRREETSEALRITAALFHAQVISPPENLGNNRGMVWACEQLKDQGELMVVVDGDAYPTTKGWDRALLECMADPAERIGAACLDVSQGYVRYQGDGKPCTVAGHRCVEYPGAESTDIGIVYADYVHRACSRIDQWYAGTGAWDILTADGKRQVHLVDYHQQHPHPVPQPMIYHAWKRAINGGQTRLNFDKWLNEQLLTHFSAT